jgi:hypothetical protein
MRMWMIDPKTLCRKHLIGEHGEIHKHKHIFEKHYSIDKRIELGQIEPLAMKQRHDTLAKEMLNRGYKHESPYIMPDLSYLPLEQIYFMVNKRYALNDLHGRCPECKKLWETNITNEQ